VHGREKDLRQVDIDKLIHYICIMENEDVIIKLYQELKSVWKVGEILGHTGQYVHTYLNKKGIDTKKPKEFTDEQIEELINIYKNFKYGDGKIDKFCLKYNKSRQNVSRKARRLGLTTRSRENCDEHKEKISKIRHDWYLNNEHPKGMKGKTHTEKVKKILSDNSKKMWADKDCYLNSKEYRDILSERASKLQSVGIFRNRYSRGKQGTYDINGKSIFFRSLWEANYALYLDFLIKNKQIQKWEFEPETFWFDKIKRGVRSYKPDFKVFENNGSICYHEVKGWMDDKSKTKLNRMRIYYPDIKIVLIQQKSYKEIQSKFKGIIKFF
jgi:hypothetical protein